MGCVPNCQLLKLKRKNKRDMGQEDNIRLKRREMEKIRRIKRSGEKKKKVHVFWFSDMNRLKYWALAQSLRISFKLFISLSLGECFSHET